MFNEYDVVVANRELSKNVPAGSIGTVLIVHDPGVAYLVEFTEGIETLDLLTVRDEDLTLVKEDVAR